MFLTVLFTIYNGQEKPTRSLSGECDKVYALHTILCSCEQCSGEGVTGELQPWLQKGNKQLAKRGG